MSGPLRLRALAPGDYAVLAACLQDAAMPVSEMAFLPGARRFAAVFDRFMWERAAAARSRRAEFVVRSALRFEGVGAARSRAIDRAGGAAPRLLTLAPEAGAVALVFAGGGAIRLEGLAGKPVAAYLEDIAEPRPAPAQPSERARAERARAE